MAEVESLKAQGNEHFVRGEFLEAEKLYCDSIELEKSQTNDNKILHILYTNRSAARLSLKKYVEALEDASMAIAANRSFVKAYFRKACALEKLGEDATSYQTWLDAAANCEGSAWLTKQLKEAKARWIKVFKNVLVTSKTDLIDRYTLVTETRLKLSTLAHFWNISSESERLQVIFVDKFRLIYLDSIYFLYSLS